MVEEDRRLLKVFPKPPMVCYTRSRNIREKLVRARLPPVRSNLLSRNREDGFKRCNRSYCKLCSFCSEATERGKTIKTVKISSTGEYLPIKRKLTCTTKNILYIITCSKGDRTCPHNPQYGGETGQQAYQRSAEHHGTVTQQCHINTKTPVGQHFRGPGHCAGQMVFTPVEKITSSNVFVRKIRERHLINSHDLISNGLNKRL